MILILDANALLWWLQDDATLASEARGAIASGLNDVIVSAASIWEIELKRALGRLRSPERIVELVEAEGFDILAISGRDAERAAALPPHHRDPFDRMLVAQAIRLDAVLVSRDRVLDAYAVDVLSA